MEYQLRRYKVRDGEMDAFVDLWRSGVVPARRAYGFTVAGAWTIEESNEFVWILGHDGADGYEAANATYYASPERAAIDPEPASFLEQIDHWMMRAVEP